MNSDYDLFVHVAFVLLGLSYLIRGILALRIIAVIASCFMIVYNVFAYEHPIWVVIGWNFSFIAINLAHIGWLLKERSTMGLSERERQLWQQAFNSLSIPQFRKLMRVAYWRKAVAGELLTQQGKFAEQPELFFLLSGQAQVSVNGQDVAHLRDGAFIAEISFLTGRAPMATVIAQEGAQLVCWPREELMQMLQDNPPLHVALQRLLGQEMLSRLAPAAVAG
jgi:hypothetical protein